MKIYSTADTGYWISAAKAIYEKKFPFSVFGFKVRMAACRGV
jgi:hypothetical protein